MHSYMFVLLNEKPLTIIVNAFSSAIGTKIHFYLVDVTLKTFCCIPLPPSFLLLRFRVENDVCLVLSLLHTHTIEFLLFFLFFYVTHLVMTTSNI